MTQPAAATSNFVSRWHTLAFGAGNWLLDLVFPPKCALCSRVDCRLCVECGNRLAAVPLEIATRELEGFAGLCATGPQAGILRAAVRAFKYNDALDLCQPLAERLLAVLRRQTWPIDVIVPVPLHTDREMDRGYNQSDVLSQPVARELALPCESAWLRRTRDTDQQARLTAAERRRNVAGAFSASADVAGKSVLLVDDVLTTGSTLSECARALQRQQAESVYGITVSASQT